MNAIMGAIQKTISISLFNRGLAGKIFESVKHTGPKVVMKNNTAECVLMSPAEYVRLMNEVNDARLILLADKRMQHYNANKTISQEAVDQEFGFTPEDLDNADEVEIE